MAKKQSIIGNAELKELMSGNSDFLRPLVQQVVQEVLESEMEDLLQATKHRQLLSSGAPLSSWCTFFRNEQ